MSDALFVTLRHFVSEEVCGKMKLNERGKQKLDRIPGSMLNRCSAGCGCGNNSDKQNAGLRKEKKDRKYVFACLQ